MTSISETKSNSVTNSENVSPITMTLNNNRFKLKESTGQWILESSDLDIATLEIETLVDEKETLVKSLSTSISQIDALQQEIVEINDMKSVVLEMLMSERQKRIELEEEVESYKEELRESYAVIVELRKLIPQTQ